MEINKIYCENCLDTMARMPDGFIDLTVTSPPYDSLRKYHGYEFDFEAIAKELFRVTKDGGVVVWVVGDATINGSETGTSFRQALYFKDVCGFNLCDTMIWNKGCFTSPQTTRYPNVFEYMFILSKGQHVCNQIKDRRNKKVGTSSIHTIRKPGGETVNMYADGRKTSIGYLGTRFNIWDVPPEQSMNNRLHPAPFSEKLAMGHILSWSNEGDLVYDPMCGSGTVPKKAIQTKRNWIASEISQEYCEIIKKRVRNTNPVMFA